MGASKEAGVVALTLTYSGEKDIRDDLFFAMAERRYAVLSMERREMSLESIYLSLTEDKREEP